MSRDVLVVAHPGREAAVAAADRAARALRRHGMNPLVESDTDGASVDGLELVMVFGGDGTILRAAELTRGSEVPLLGVNLGHVGFLAEAEQEHIDEAVRRLAIGDYDVEERGTIEALVMPPDAPPTTMWALNEAAVEKADRSKIIEVVLEVDGRPLSSFGCDGVVMATSTGSTAHAFSAGGPVVWPDVDAMLLVPISAHALFARPIVVGPASVLAVELLGRSASPGVLICDGRRRAELPVGTRVEVRRSPVPVRLARLSHAPFTARLVHRFALPVSGWRGRPVDELEHAAAADAAAGLGPLGSAEPASPSVPDAPAPGGPSPSVPPAAGSPESHP